MKAATTVGIALLSMLGISGGICSAQTYPSKTIRFIVPFAVGGGANLVARVIAQKMSENFKQQVIVDNRGGSGGIIGTTMAVEAAPDGYTIALGLPATITVAPSLFKNLPYNPLTDLVPVGLVGTSAYILSVHPSLPVKSVKDLIRIAKARPGQINFSSGGSGAGNHLAAELFKSLTHTNMVHIPYKGGGAALIAVLTGEAQVIFGSMLSTIPQIKAGKIRALAVTSSTRASAVPELPTIAEAGVPGYDVDVWMGVFVPKGTPKQVTDTLNRQVVTIMNDPDVKKRLASEGFDSVTTTSDGFAKLLQSESVKWAKVVKESGARVD
jgi:tripartite-type tricarboxylate transporter receptor subunit TctC